MPPRSRASREGHVADRVHAGRPAAGPEWRIDDPARTCDPGARRGMSVCETAPAASETPGVSIDEFRDFFTAHAPQIRRWARGAVGEDLADDVVVETFAVAWRRWAEMPQEPAHRRAWLFVVARHKAAHLRAREGRALMPVPQLALGPDSGIEPDLADRVVASRRALDVLRSLGPEDREVLILVGVDGLSPADAAAVLGCTVSAMTTRLSRARRRLETAMQRAESPTGRGGDR